MPASDFLSALADLNTANPENLQNFLDATQVRSPADLPEPVPIGIHDGVQYFIKSSDKTVQQDPSSAAIPPAKIGDVYYGISTYEAISIPGGEYTTNDLDNRSPHEIGDLPIGQTMRTGLSYGFGLGRLYHKLPEEAHMEDSDFYVIYNAVDKSIWVAFDFEPYDETGEINPVQPEYGDPYRRLPLDK